jgi:hypothetical protein
MLIYLSKSNQGIKDKISYDKEDAIHVVKNYIFLISEISYFFKKLKHFLFNKKEKSVLLGSGGSDINAFIQDFGIPFVKWVIYGLAWDFVSKKILDNYSFLNTRKKKYIEIVDLAYEPGTYHSLKFLIPNNLEEQKINYVLDDAGKILESIKKIRYMFGSKEIIFKYNRYWHIKIKKTSQYY